MTRPPLRTILYVEDNPNIRALAKLALEKLGGFAMHTCESGAEALAAVEAGLQPDLLLLDVMLPGMDGPTILQCLRRLPQTAAAPVIFMTAKAQASEIAHFMSLGALGVITKPFQPTLLPDQIRRLWNSAPAPTAKAAELDDVLVEFRARFLAALPKQIEELKQHLLQLAGADATSRLPALHNLLHVISGSAGTFGYDELGNRARTVEALLRKQMDGADDASLQAVAEALQDFLQWQATSFTAATPAATPSAPASSAHAPVPVQAPAEQAARAGQPYRVLIVDDDEATALRYKAILNGARIEAAILTRPEDIFPTLEKYRPELIVLDLYMPGCSGAELAALIRQDKTFLDVPIVFLSNEHNLDRQADAIQSGADYFLTKPITPERLVSTLSSRAERYRSLRGLIMCDGLTGLYNHTAIKEHLQREVARARRSQLPLSVAMIDLDHFKQINDAWGHPTGDQVLRALARLMQQRFRRSDVVGRYGGEEFLVILPGTSAAPAFGVLDDVRSTFAKIRHQSEGYEFTATLSAGIAELGDRGDGGDGDDCNRLIQTADAMLYQAKAKGRNCVEVK